MVLVCWVYVLGCGCVGSEGSSGFIGRGSGVGGFGGSLCNEEVIIGKG